MPRVARTRLVLPVSNGHARYMMRFWDASARKARLSAWLAYKLDIPGFHSEDAYTFGLFHDCGIPILMMRFPHCKEMLGQANRNTQTEFTANSSQQPSSRSISPSSNLDWTSRKSGQNSAPPLWRRCKLTRKIWNSCMRKQGKSSRHRSKLLQGAMP